MNGAIRIVVAAGIFALSALPCAAALAQTGASVDAGVGATGTGGAGAPSLPAPAYPVLADGGRSVVLGRYGTASADPPPELSEPMDVVAALTFPRQNVRTVGEALLWALSRTGYRFDGDAASAGAREFLELPLPESQRQIGPYSVRSIVQVLMGTAWRPQINAVNRTVLIVQAGRDGQMGQTGQTAGPTGGVRQASPAAAPSSSAPVSAVARSAAPLASLATASPAAPASVAASAAARGGNRFTAARVAAARSAFLTKGGNLP